MSPERPQTPILKVSDTVSSKKQKKIDILLKIPTSQDVPKKPQV
jgi:hypothetical protein